jgi:hypothetical protein
MQIGGSATDQMFQSLDQFRKAWPKQGWSWDYRFNMVASSFHVDLIPDAERALVIGFPESYDSKSFPRAPEHVRELGESVGGIRADQRMYAGPAVGRLVPIGLWWPWGDEITISLRIGLAGYVGEHDLRRLQMNFNALG